MICLFSGDAAAVGVILQLMCFNRDPKLWNIPVEDLEQDKNRCEEPLPLNRAGETPLDVARQAGHFEEIVQNCIAQIIALYFKKVSLATKRLPLSLVETKLTQILHFLLKVLTKSFSSNLFAKKKYLLLQI